MQYLLILLAAVQIASPAPTPASVRGDRFQVAVPQGWKTLVGGEDVLLQHATGASLLVRRVTPVRSLNDYAQQQAERVMTPLGFAKLGDPRVFKDTHEEWVQYEIV